MPTISEIFLLQYSSVSFLVLVLQRLI